jgi:hypothetical protein
MPYQLPGSGRKTEPCIICTGDANIVARDLTRAIVDCSVCGDYTVTRSAQDDFGLPLRDLKRRALARHLIRKMQREVRPTADWDFFDSLARSTLPTPAEAADNLLLLVAEQADGRPGRQITINYPDPKIQASIGVIDEADLEWAAATITNEGFLQTTKRLRGQSSQLTPKGWARVEELKKAHVTSRYAFFARQFRNTDLDDLFENCLRPAIAQTGYELRPVTQRAGLIDAIMEDEIRRCRFLLADLSDDNPGAYWEAGFAEGLGKPVIYICRAKEGDEEKKTHFDANHRNTVRWGDPISREQTARQLKAVIRNSLLGDAKQED